MKPDLTLEAKILAAIDGRILSPKRIAAAIGYGTSQVEIQAINRTMLLLQKQKRARYQDGGWTKTDVESPSPMPPTRKPAKIESESSAPVPRPTDESGSVEPAQVASIPAPAASERETSTEASGEAQDTPRRPHRATTDMKRKAADQKARITELLKQHKALTAPHVLELLADPSLTMKDVQNRLTYMRQSGLVEATGHGYALTKQTGTPAPAAAPTPPPAIATSTDCNGGAPAPVASNSDESVERGNTAQDLPDEYEDGVGLNTRDLVDLDKLPVHANEIDQARETAAEAPLDARVGPMRDIRAKLMDMADLVRDGKLTPQQVSDMLEIYQYAAAIDLKATAAA